MAIIKHGNNALSSVTAFPSAVPTGKPVLLSTATASSSASIEFTSGIDNTYDIYKWEYINIHPSTQANFQFNLSSDGGNNYNVTKTTTNFSAFQNEAGSSTSLGYRDTVDLAQSSANQMVAQLNTDNDDNACGSLFLFSPASTTFVKHFISVSADSTSTFSQQRYVAGYANTTSAINAIKFVAASGNLDSGTIKMYGISA